MLKPDDLIRNVSNCDFGCTSIVLSLTITSIFNSYSFLVYPIFNTMNL